MRIFVLLLLCGFYSSSIFCQESITLKFRNQYKSEVSSTQIVVDNKTYTGDKDGKISLPAGATNQFTVSAEDHKPKTFYIKDADVENTIYLHKLFTWKDLLTPMFYIIFGGVWFIVFVVFAETGLFAGFFLPGDSLLFVTGIYSNDIVKSGLGFDTHNSFFNLLILGLLISAAGILGNFVGYWFGRKSGPFLFERKDTFFFKKKYLYQAKDFYDKHGGGAIVMARFLPIVRTFAPIVAGIVKMDKKKFTFYNIVGCLAWVYAMLLGGHYLQQFILSSFGFDLKDHLEVIVIGIVLITTAPVILKLVFGKTKSQPVPGSGPDKEIANKHSA